MPPPKKNPDLKRSCAVLLRLFRHELEEITRRAVAEGKHRVEWIRERLLR